MAREMRRIVLTDAEFNDALRAFVRSRDQLFHGGVLVESRLNGSEPLEVAVTIRDRHGQSSDMILGAAHLAAVMIDSCIARRIPVPRQAAKSVKRVGGGVALDIMIGEG